MMIAMLSFIQVKTVIHQVVVILQFIGYSKMNLLDLRGRKDSIELMFAQFGLKVERGVKEACDLCRTAYSVFNRQHICKRCQRSVCSQCSPFKVKTYLSTRAIRLHRNCTVCRAESVLIQQYIEENKLKFRQDSDLMLIWSKTLSDRRGVKVGRSKSSAKNYIQLENLWASLNFSFREFVGRLVERSGVGDGDLVNMIGNGIEEIEKVFADRLEEGVYLYLFFLCHAGQEVAVNLTLFALDLLQRTSKVKPKLKRMIESIGFSEVQAYKLEEFIMDNEMLLRDRLSVNVLPVTATFQIINSIIINKSINGLWRGLLLFLFHRKEVVFKNLSRASLIILDLLRNPTVVDLKQQLKQAEEDEQEIKYNKLFNEYKNLLAKNQKLEKDLSEGHQNNPNKILTDSIFGEEITSHSTIFKSEELYLILQGKNEEIIKLKIKNEELQTTLKEHKEKAELLEAQNSKFKEEIGQRQAKETKLQSENNSLKKSNTLLLNKMKELSKLLMDQQEREMLKNDEAIELAVKQLGKKKEEECAIY